MTHTLEHPANNPDLVPDSWKPKTPALEVVEGGPAPKFMEGEPVRITVKANSKDWHSLRSQGIGSSDIAAVLGINPYQTPHDIWLIKRGLANVDENTAMRHGRYVEPFIAAEYKRLCKERGIKVKVKGSCTYRHPEFPHFLANPDREIEIGGTWGLLECKAVGSWAARNFGHDGSDQIPQHYMTQIMWQLIVTGAKFVHLAALIDGRKVQPYTFTFDPSLSSSAHVFKEADGREMMRLADLFWTRYVVAGREPKMTGQESDTQWLQKQHTYENGGLTNTDEACDKECKRLKRALKRSSRAQLVEEECKNRIKKFMADRNASELESTVGLFKWRTDKNGKASFHHPVRSENA